MAITTRQEREAFRRNWERTIAIWQRTLRKEV